MSATYSYIPCLSSSKCLPGRYLGILRGDEWLDTGLESGEGDEKEKKKVAKNVELIH